MFPTMEAIMSTQVFTISEVSDITGLPASTLRYYERRASSHLWNAARPGGDATHWHTSRRCVSLNV